LNYLAHFYLSGNDEKLLLGQFLGDAVKGNKYNNFPSRIRDGILLHRFIDDQTDRHPACREFRSLLRPTFGLHSSITIDILLDHILAIKWSEYSELPLSRFAHRTYANLSKYSSFLPERMLIVLKYMQENDWLMAYSQPQGIRKSLRGMSLRVSGGKVLEEAAERLETLIPLAQACFEIYFPDLVVSCKVKINTFAPDN